VGDDGGLPENETVVTVGNVASSAGVTTAALVDTEAFVQAGEPANVEVEVAGGGTISASISAEALSLVGGNAVVLVTAINVSLLASFQAPRQEGQDESEVTRLASQPVSIRLVNEDGEEISIADLTEPIEVSLSVPNKTEDMVCGWFDEETNDWRTDNIELVDGSGDNFICATTHLTIFGAIVEGIVGTLKCSNADLLSEKGIRSLADDDGWSRRPGAVMFWILIAIEVSLMMYIGQRSAIQRATRGWDDEYLLTASAAFDKKLEHEAESLLKRGKTLGTLGAWEDAKPIYTLSGMTDYLTTLTAQMAVASQQGINTEDLGAILKGGMTKKLLEQLEKSSKHVWEPEEEDERDDLQRGQSQASSSNSSKRGQGKRSQSALVSRHHTRAALASMMNLQNVPVLKDVSKDTRYAMNNFMEMTFLERLRVLFYSGNAWISLGQFSFTVPPTFRTLMLSMRVHGSLLCSAFFFTATGAPTKEIDECSPVGFWQNVGRNIVVSTFAILVGSIPFAIMSTAAYRSFVYKESWDTETKRRYLRNMRIHGRLLWCIGVVYVAFCTFFVAIFLANVGKGATMDWITTATFDLFMTIVVNPLAQAFLLALMLSLSTAIRPKQVEEQIEELQQTFKHLIDEDAPLEQLAHSSSQGAADEALRAIAQDEDRKASSAWMPRGAGDAEMLPGMLPDEAATQVPAQVEGEHSPPAFVMPATLPALEQMSPPPSAPAELPPLPPVAGEGVKRETRGFAPDLDDIPEAAEAAMRSPGAVNDKAVVAPEDSTDPYASLPEPRRGLHPALVFDRLARQTGGSASVELFVDIE